MKKIILFLLAYLLAFPALADSSILKKIPTFDMLSNFDAIKQNYREITRYIDNTNIIPDVKSYELKINGIIIYLHEWNGKLHEVNYKLLNIDRENSSNIAKALFNEYRKGFDWIEEGVNPWGEWFELSNHSIKGFNVYSQGYRTVSFSSLNKLEEETRIKQSK